jgi:hypothetical protein
MNFSSAEVKQMPEHVQDIVKKFIVPTPRCFSTPPSSKLPIYLTHISWRGSLLPYLKEYWMSQ